jgi:uncharacterized protein YcbK (DUF882 family)
MRANALDIRVPDVDANALAMDFATYIYGGISLFPTLTNPRGKKVAFSGYLAI